MIKKITLIILFGFLLYLVVPTVNGADDKNAKKEALKSAESWLMLVDTGEYGKSWENASKLFRQTITKDDWVKAISGVRPPLGKVESRKLESETYTTELPGVPDGEYVVMQYSTVFSYKSNAIETITPMKDPDGEWRVSGYYIK